MYARLAPFGLIVCITTLPLKLLPRTTRSPTASYDPVTPRMLLLPIPVSCMPLVQNSTCTVSATSESPSIRIADDMGAEADPAAQMPEALSMKTPTLPIGVQRMPYREPEDEPNSSISERRVQEAPP
jgi:hypothetical protein